jgi:hypothetical protein
MYKTVLSKHLSYGFPIQNGLKQGDTLSPLRFNFALEYAMRKAKYMKREWNWNTSACGQYWW